MILEDLGMEILSMKEAGVDVDIVEDGASFEENAEIKARAVARVLTNDIVLADDPDLRSTTLTKRRGSIPRVLPERIPLMISRTTSCWIGWKGCRMKSARRGLCAR